MWVQGLGWEDPLERGMATHSSILTWRIRWAEEPGGLQSMGSQSRTRLKRLSSSIAQGFPGGSDGEKSACSAGDPGSGRPLGEGNGNPLQYSCLENPRDREAWQAIVHRTAKSETTTKVTWHAFMCALTIVPDTC